MQFLVNKKIIHIIFQNTSSFNFNKIKRKNKSLQSSNHIRPKSSQLRLKTYSKIGLRFRVKGNISKSLKLLNYDIF